MTVPEHQYLANGRWQTLSLMEQMGNIGSEVGRAIAWDKRGNGAYREKALGRALELFDLTLSDGRWRWRLREIARAREAVCDFFYGGNAYRDSADALEKYFLNFAIAARRQR